MSWNNPIEEMNWVKMKDRLPEYGRLVVVKAIDGGAKTPLTRRLDDSWEYYSDGKVFAMNRVDHLEWLDDEVGIKMVVISHLQNRQRRIAADMEVLMEKMSILINSLKGSE